MTDKGKATENRDWKGLAYLCWFAVGFLGTGALVLLARRPLGYLLENRQSEVTVALLVLLLSGVGAVLWRFLPHDLQKVVISLYIGAAIVVIGSVAVALFSPGSREETPLAAAPTAAPITLPATATTSAALPSTATPQPVASPTTSVFQSELPTPPGGAGCLPPEEWLPYQVKPGETINSLAWSYWTTENILSGGNCLTSWTLYAGQLIHVPDRIARGVCTRPYGWVDYTIQPNDTLSGLAYWFDLSVYDLRQRNCLMSEVIYPYATMWVPYRAPATSPPVPTHAPWPTWTSIPPATLTPDTPTPEPPASTSTP